MDAIEILDGLQVHTVGDELQVATYLTMPPVLVFSASWLVLYHAQEYLKDAENFRRKRNLEGSPTRLLCFPNFTQRQIKLLKEEKHETIIDSSITAERNSDSAAGHVAD